jgi:hypothetical protein
MMESLLFCWPVLRYWTSRQNIGIQAQQPPKFYSMKVVPYLGQQHEGWCHTPGNSLKGDAIPGAPTEGAVPRAIV